MQLYNRLFFNEEKRLAFFSIFIAISLIVYPATVLLVPKLNGIVFGLFSLLGLHFLFKNRHEAMSVNRDEIKFYLSIGVFFLIALLITMNAGFVSKIMSKYLHILLIIPIYIYLRHIGIKQFYLWYGLVVGAFMSATIAIYDVRILNMPIAHGFINPIQFGDMSLVLGCMAIVGFGWFRQRSQWKVVLPVLAFLCGLVASILSGSRGGWIALPFLVALFFWYIRLYFSFKCKLVSALLLMLIFVGIYATPQTNVKHQIDITINNMQQYSESEVSSAKRANSVGQRLEMWQASLKIFLDNPLLGVGWGRYKENYQLQVDKGLRNATSSIYIHPHSEYFLALASAGIVGFIALMTFFLVPAWLFIKVINQGKTADVRRLALAGLVLIVAFMVFGLTEPLLYRTRTVNFFSFYLAVFMAAVYGQNKVVSR